jgi:hypothetical protein
MASRMTRILAGLGLILAIVGVLPATAIVRDSRLLWTLVPVMSAAWVFCLIPRRGFAAVWVLTGVSLGFVVLAAWSIGLFFAPSALLLVATAVGHSVSMRAGWQAVLVPAWLLAGPTGLCVLFFVRDQMLAKSQGEELTEAPAIVAGTRLFLAVAAFLVVVTSVRWFARRAVRR